MIVNTLYNHYNLTYDNFMVNMCKYELLWQIRLGKNIHGRFAYDPLTQVFFSYGKIIAKILQWTWGPEILLCQQGILVFFMQEYIYFIIKWTGYTVATVHTV